MLEKVNNPDSLATVDYKSDAPVEDFKRFEDTMKQILSVPRHESVIVNMKLRKEPKPSSIKANNNE